MSDEDVKIELAQDRSEIVVDAKLAPEPDAKTTSDDTPASDVESDYAVKVEPTDPNRASVPKTYSAASSRRTKLHPWLKNSNAMLGAAIVVGGLAAILVGNLVLWMLKPSPKPSPRSQYATVHHNIELHRPSASSGDDAFRRA